MRDENFAGWLFVFFGVLTLAWVGFLVWVVYTLVNWVVTK